MGRGGKRVGAGRKPSTDPTIIIRVPKSKVNLVKELIKTEAPSVLPSNQSKEKLNHCKALLNNALKLKANAGGKIKVEIRKALKLL